jgi:hypothetical protein
MSNELSQQSVLLRRTGRAPLAARPVKGGSKAVTPKSCLQVYNFPAQRRALPETLHQPVICASDVGFLFNKTFRYAEQELCAA